MTHVERKGIIDQVVREIVALTHPAKVVLFGSASRAGDEVGGDLDFLVVVHDDQDAAKIIDQLNLEVTTRTLPCDFVVANERTLKKYGQTSGLVYRDALNTGTVLYAA